MTEDQAIAKARDLATDDLEIDDNPATSVADRGIWVAAWVWIEDTDEADEDDDEERSDEDVEFDRIRHTL